MQMTDAAKLLKLLGDPTRLTLLKLLSSHEYCVCEFVEIFDISQPAISQHLRKLKDVDIVREERRGQWIFYSLHTAHKDYPLIHRILQHLDLQDEFIRQLEAKALRICCD